MLSNEEKTKIKQSIRDLKSQISNERKLVNSLKAEKEKAFREKEELKATLTELISKVKTLRNDSENKSIAQLRKERDKYNAKVKETIDRIKELRKEVVASGGKKVSVGRIKSDIERLEESIEIEGYDYNQEQKVLDKIKKLKKVYEEHAKAEDVSEKIKELSKDLEGIKTLANESHEKFKEKLDEGKDSLKDFKTVSKDILKVKKQQEAAWDLFLEKKNEFLKASKELKTKLSELYALEAKVGAEVKEKKKQEEVKKKELLEERAKTVEEKLKKSGKITTEDLALMRED